MRPMHLTDICAVYNGHCKRMRDDGSNDVGLSHGDAWPLCSTTQNHHATDPLIHCCASRHSAISHLMPLHPCEGTYRSLCIQLHAKGPDPNRRHPTQNASQSQRATSTRQHATCNRQPRHAPNARPTWEECLSGALLLYQESPLQPQLDPTLEKPPKNTRVNPKPFHDMREFHCRM